MQHSSGWLTLYYRLPSRLPDFSYLTLRSIEVAAVAPVNPPEPRIDPCLGYVGQDSSRIDIAVYLLGSRTICDGCCRSNQHEASSGAACVYA